MGKRKKNDEAAKKWRETQRKEQAARKKKRDDKKAKHAKALRTQHAMGVKRLASKARKKATKKLHIDWKPKGLGDCEECGKKSVQLIGGEPLVDDLEKVDGVCVECAKQFELQLKLEDEGQVSTVRDGSPE